MFKVVAPRLITGAAVLVLCISISACGNDKPEEGGNASPTAVSAATPGPTEATPKATVASAPVTIYEVGSDAEGMGKLEPVKTEIDVNNSSAMVLALNKMAELEDSPLPKGTRVRSVRLDDDLATVDFSSEFQSNFQGGDMREALMFNSILQTIGQFPKVRKVQILVEGKKVSIGGTQDTTQPMDIPADLVASAKSR